MRDLPTRLAIRIVARALRLLGATWRLELRGPNPLQDVRRTGLLTAVWHRNLLIGSYVFRDAEVHVPISLSRDGDQIAAVIRHMGFADPPRGSSSNGRFSLVKDLVRRARAGAVITILTDGPRGPARRSKSGVAHVARMARVDVVPIAFSACPCVQFGSWDGMLLPWPFARVVCHVGEPVDLSGVPAERFDEEATRRLDAALDRLTDDLDREVGLVPRATRRD